MNTENALLLRPSEAARLLGISRSKLYEMLAMGKIPSIKLDKLRRIPAEALRDWVKAQAAGV